MENNKRNSHIVFYILLFIVAIFFEFYWISTRPYDYFMLIGIGLVVLITGFLTFDGIFKAHSEAEELRREQNETMIKAQKAIYLASKRNASDAENMQIQSLKAVNVLMDRMVDTITERQLESISSKNNEPVDLSGLINEMAASNAKLAKEIQNAVTVNQLVKANEDLIRNVQNVLSGQAVDIPPAPEAMAFKSAAAGPVKPPKPVITPEPDNSPKPSKTPEPVIIPEPVTEPEPLTAPQPVTVPEPIAVPEPVTEPEPLIMEDALKEDAVAAMSGAYSTTADINDANTINIDDMTLEELDEMDSIETDIASAEAAVADASQTVEAMEAARSMDEDPDAESLAAEMDNDASVADAAVAMDKGANDPLTPEEIAALFANL